MNGSRRYPDRPGGFVGPPVSAPPYPGALGGPLPYGGPRLPGTVGGMTMAPSPMAPMPGMPGVPPMGVAPPMGLLGVGPSPGALSVNATNGPVDDSDPEYEEMVGDLRRSFVGWLQKTEMELRQHRSDLRRSRQAFEEEKLSVWQQFMIEKQREIDKIRDDRRRGEDEIGGQLRQVQADVEEARRRMGEERTRIEQNGHTQRRHVAHEYDKFKQEYGLFEAERQRLVCPELAAEATVDLNVGGTVFETSRSTLVQQSGSFLEAILSGRYQISRDRSGRVFLNRDPDHFRTILNFLRNPQTPPMPRDSAESEALVKESAFYNIHFFPFPLVFACGGHDGYENLRAMEVLDVGNQCWRPCKPMGTPRTYFGAATLRNRLHVYGGQNLDYRALSELEIYDCLRDVWDTGASMSTPRRNCASIEHEGRIYAFGGFDGTKIINSVEAYDSRMKGWMLLEPLPTPRSSAMACARGGKVWVCGGTSGSRLKTIEIYDARANRWETSKVDMTEVRSAGQACSCVNHLFALGGTDEQQNIHCSVECLDVDDNAFGARRSMQEARMDFAACEITDSIMVGGGQNHSVLASTEFYRPELDEWQAGPPMMFPRYGHQYLLCTL